MNHKTNILLIEDSATDAKLIVRQLLRSGFDLAWERVETPAALEAALVNGSVDLIVSDSNVPKLRVLDALALCKRVAPRLPFVIVSGSITEAMAVQAIRAGAADYITKENLARLGPVVARELATRTEAAAQEQPPLRILLAGLPLPPALRGAARWPAASLGDASVVAEAASGKEVLALLEQVHPDVVLIDSSFAGPEALEATRLLLEHYPRTRILLVAPRADAAFASRALAAGASGCLVEDPDFTELQLALQAVASGSVWLSPTICRSVIEGLLRGPVPGAREVSLSEELTARQREVLRLIAQGNSTRRIAERLHLSVKTIETHRAHLMERLGIHDVAGLVLYAARVGIVRLER